MIYLNDEDLELESFQRFITESTGGDTSLKDKAELKAIALCKTFLTNYDVDDIFDEEDPIRDEYLAEIMAIIVLHKLIGRNAARKLPTDAKEGWDWAMKQLEKIQKGSITLLLPPKLDTDGNVDSLTIWGNNTNTDFYI
jgi:hypothetical protein